MNDSEADNPGIIAKPPLIYLAFILIGLALGYVWPVGIFPESAWYAAGTALIVFGVVIQAVALWQFKKAGTRHETDKPATALVTGGPFRYSRNPIYVSLTLIYAGIALLANNLWVFVLLIPLHAVMQYGVIHREERYLERKFGEDYGRYKVAVRRWL